MNLGILVATSGWMSTGPLAMAYPSEMQRLQAWPRGTGISPSKVTKLIGFQDGQRSFPEQSEGPPFIHVGLA